MVFIRAEIIGELPSGQKRVSLCATGADGISFYTDETSIVTFNEMQPPKRGKWKYIGTVKGYRCPIEIWKCDACDSFCETKKGIRPKPYCADCGARMKGGAYNAR